MENVLDTREPPVIPVETTHHITDHVTSSETHLLTQHQSLGHSVLTSVMQDSHNMEELNDKVSTQISSSNKPVESVNQGEEIVDKEKTVSPVSPPEGQSHDEVHLCRPPTSGATNGAIDLSVKHSNADDKNVCQNESIKTLRTDEELPDSDSQIETETFAGDGNNSTDSKGSCPTKEKRFHMSCFQAGSMAEKYSDDESDSGYSALFSLQSPRQVPRVPVKLSSVKSTGPAVFVGRSAYFK